MDKNHKFIKEILFELFKAEEEIKKLNKLIDDYILVVEILRDLPEEFRDIYRIEFNKRTEKNSEIKNHSNLTFP